jgi:hypothetical protein
MIALSVLLAGSATAGGFGPGKPYLWAGHLENAEGPVDGPVAAIFTVTTSAGVALDTQIENTLVVVDGDFVVDLLVPVTSDPLFLRVTINSVVLEPPAPLPQGWPRAFSADNALASDVADEARAVGPLTTVMSTARLGSGAVEVPLTRITGFPAAFADGDQGLAFVAGTTIDFSNGTIGIKAASLPGTAFGGVPQVADLADGTIATTDLGNASVLAADLSALPLTKLAPKTLTGRHFGTARVTLFEVTEPGCPEPVGAVLESPTCRFQGAVTCTGRIGANTFTGHVPCAATNRTTECFTGSSSDCPNTPAGVLVFP